jgi:putative MFS transporter
MQKNLGQELADAIDGGNLSPLYWTTLFLIALLLVCEVFDFVLVAFLLADVTSRWELTFGQASIVLLAFGIGAIIGALGIGWFADRFGRKWAIGGGGALFSLSAGAIAFIPDGNWVIFAILRFLVGFGYAGTAAALMALVVELVPTRYRTVMSTAVFIPGPIAIMLASAVAALLLPDYGWRVVALIGVVPIFVALWLAIIAPESARWLAANGRLEEAQCSLAKLVGNDAASSVNWDAPLDTSHGKASYSELFAEKRLFWLVVFTYIGPLAAFTGVILWGPLVLKNIMGLSPAEAAGYFFYVSAAGLAGRIFFAFFASRFGRVKAAYLCCYGGAAMLIGVGLGFNAAPDSLWTFLGFLMAAFFLLDGGLASNAPYAAEVYPVRLAALGSGLGQSSSGLGKLIGPVVLAFAAGTGNVISPTTTADAVLPGFALLAVCAIITGVAFSILGVETNRKPLRLE